VKNLALLTLLAAASCTLLIDTPPAPDAGFPGRSDTGLLDVGLRDARPDVPSPDFGVAIDVGQPGADVLDAAAPPEAGAPVADVGVSTDSGELPDALPAGDAAGHDVVTHEAGQADAAAADVIEFADAGEPVDAGVGVDSGAMPDIGIPPGSARSIALGGLHTCVLVNDGTLECFGDNAFGQLGLEDLADRNGARVVPGIMNIDSVALGAGTSCAVLANGSLACWGRNDFGQTGDGTTTHHFTPRAVGNLSEVAQVAVGSGHTCARTRLGTVYCWGRNAEGQIGDGTRDRRAAPTQVQGLSNVLFIAAGFQHTCVLRSDQSVLCWGANGNGQLGFAGGDSLRPRRVLAPAPVTAMSTVWDHSCAVMSGVAACWGWNEFGQLGTNSREQSREPTVVPGVLGVSYVAAGGHHSCGLRGGEVLCWGQNQGGQLGTGNVVDSNVAVPVQGLLGQMVEVDSGYYHTCSLSSRGVVWCWGYNEHGQIGDGTWVDRSVPQRVWGL